MTRDHPIPKTNHGLSVEVITRFEPRNAVQMNRSDKLNIQKNVKLRSDPLKTEENRILFKITIFKRNVWQTGKHCRSVIHFYVKSQILTFYISLSLLLYLFETDHYETCHFF